MTNLLMSKKTPVHKLIGVFLFGVLLVVVDQLVKNSVDNIFRNYNFIFSLPLNIFIMYTIYLGVLFAILFYFYKSWNRLKFIESFAWVLILAGAVSNFGERLVLGYVRDFIYIFNGVLNFADFYIILGVIILLFGQFDFIETKKIK